MTRHGRPPTTRLSRRGQRSADDVRHHADRLLVEVADEGEAAGKSGGDDLSVRLEGEVVGAGLRADVGMNLTVRAEARVERAAGLVAGKRKAVAALTRARAGDDDLAVGP